MRFSRMNGIIQLTLAALLLGAVPQGVSGQTVQANPVSAALPKECWPDVLLKGRDTVFAYVPCRSLDVLAPRFRAVVQCTLDRSKKGGWDPLLYESLRSDKRQQALYAYGRTRAGDKVTNAQFVYLTVHGYGLAVDIIHRTRHWNHPKFFYWLAQHAEACGAVAGGFWIRFPDWPHIQYGGWAGAPPQWARTTLKTQGKEAVWIRLFPPVTL